ncbi:MAG: YeeE/YedE family protein [Betaproteobacteria bacterium]|nr:YeeE/YedE family protein [Betaproteobacteria bacterium]
MEFTIHQQVLLTVLALAAIIGAIANKTNFCTMGAVSDWVNMGDTGRLRAWLLAIAVAMAGTVLLEASGLANLSGATFPPYRTSNFAWLRYLLGGLMFGVGMTLASGCGNKSLVRIGGGNLKSLAVLVIASLCAYAMLWTNFYAAAFDSWMAPLSVSLGKFGMKSQALDAIVGGMLGMENTASLHTLFGLLIVAVLLVFIFKSEDFRASKDNILGGTVIGLAVTAGWYLTGGSMGQAWKEWAELADTVPSRVEVQSFTFISPMGDTVHYLMSPANFSLINFGVTALTGVILGSLLYSLINRSFRIEWFASVGDFVNHVVGAVLMGIGGVLAMGCTIGQGVTGVSTLALGSMLTLAAIISGAAGMMKYQYWKMLREA